MLAQVTAKTSGTFFRDNVYISFQVSHTTSTATKMQSYALNMFRNMLRNFEPV